MNSRTIIISPSGNLYGSEQVLLEFLKHATLRYKVYVPKASLLSKNIVENGCKHIIKPFENLYLLYIKIFFELLFFKKKLYVNEGGHIRFIRFLAYILPFRNFYVHIRLLEDCSPQRLSSGKNNIHLITVSNYLRSNLFNYNVLTIFDPYTTENKNISNTKKRLDSPLKIGIIGRITKTKGLDDLFPILNCFETEKKDVTISFFGNYNTSDSWTTDFISKLNDYKYVKSDFRGFVKEKKQIYSDIDVVIHLNKIEALGRIIFEAVDYSIPIIAFNAGGCGELLNQLNLAEFSVNYNSSWHQAFYEKILMNRNSILCASLINAKTKIEEDFNSIKYVEALESVIK